MTRRAASRKDRASTAPPPPGGCLEVSLGAAMCPVLREFSMHWIGVKDCAPNYSISVQTPADYCVSVMTAGTGQVPVDDQLQLIQPGHAVVFAAGARRAFRAKEHWQYCSVLYRPGPGEPPPPGFDRTRILPADTGPIVALVRVICREWLASADQEIVRHLLHALDKCTRRLANPKSGPSLMDLWDQVNADLASPWTLPLLADRAKMSASTLRRKCLQELNCSPMDQVTRLRMGRASTLLASDHINVSEAAAAVGYENTFAFSRAFKRLYGVAPKPFQMQQTLMARLDVEESIASALLQHQKAARDLKQLVFPFAASAQPSAFHCVEMKHLFNRKLCGGEDVWLGADPLEHLPPGRNVYHGIPFDVCDLACVLSSSRSQRLSILPNTLVIPIGLQVKAVYVLHAGGWAGRGEKIARWTFHPDDGPPAVREIAAFEPNSTDGMIADWWPNEPPRKGADALPVIVCSDDPRDTYERHLYVAQWCNPKPQSALKQLVVQVPPKAKSVYAILAISVLFA